MSQHYVMINDTVIRQPDAGLSYNFETTYTNDSGRVMSGTAHVVPMFTVESFGYSATNLTEAEMQQILELVAKGGTYRLHYRSPYYGGWRDDYFYTGKGSLSIGSWKEDEERYESLSFNMVGVNPI